MASILLRLWSLVGRGMCLEMRSWTLGEREAGAVQAANISGIWDKQVVYGVS
jgi:hypothetical protein